MKNWTNHADRRLMNSSAWPCSLMSSAAAAGVKVDTKPPARLHAGRYRHADQLLRRRPGPSLHRSGALEPRQGMLLNNRRPASFRPPARNRNQTSDQKVGSCKSLIRASDQTFRLNPAGGTAAAGSVEKVATCRFSIVGPLQPRSVTSFVAREQSTAYQAACRH